MSYDFINKEYSIEELEDIVFNNKISKDDLDIISIYQVLSEPFIEKYKDKVSWFHVSYHQKLSEAFIEKYKHVVNWVGISNSQTLSEPFIERFKDKVNWFHISEYQKLSEQFIEKFKDKVDWDYIIQFQKLSFEFLEKHLYKFSLYIEHIDNNDIFNKNSIIALQEKYQNKYEIDKLEYELKGE